jgi:hypothetical protein
MFKPQIPRLILITAFLIFFVTTSNAEIPHAINYQGRLTDQTTGLPVTGTVDLLFKIYNCESCTDAESVLWTESHTAVTLDSGLFNVILGGNNPIPDTAFNKAARWLGITVNTDPEIMPRTAFTSVAFAYRTLKADSLGVESFIDETGDTLSGHLYFFGGNSSGGHIEVGSGYTNMELADNAATKTHIYGELFGEMILFDEDGTETVDLNAHSSTGGELELYGGDGSLAIELNAGASTNDLMVYLPDNAINAGEILNESGIASDYGDPGPTLDSVYFTDIQTVSITIPAPGYIFLIGNCYIRMHNDTAAENGAYIQISEEGGGIVPNGLGTLFTCPIASYDAYYRIPVTVNRVYYKDSPGTYEFRMEGRQYMWSSTETDAIWAKLTALYIPTSYAAVKSMVDDPGDNPEAIPIEITDEDGNPTGEIRYEVDLRYYELKAKEAQLQETAARIKTLEAELELERARDRVNDE